ncbi:hypothetical protein EST38_g5448 [Candolleomyces aberdarensis]|uniref:Nephrocystin 3-like N-terminal domain-containing protein n=1 Tax=Candolleomyces aberdarensis TaxID=2316362 RepID=A0A4Q2DM49_9AGAR|nr:hypothetical protein EST38_g5448 [Candolleomyces aberdarensis]
MPFKDLFKRLNCCTGSGDDSSEQDQDERDQQSGSPADRAQRSILRGRQDGRSPISQGTNDEEEIESADEEEHTPTIQLFRNAQGFNMHNTRINTTVLRNGSPHDALAILLANSAPSATYNSKDRSFDTPKCDEDTRVGLIEEIVNWAESDEVPSKLLCMTGSAGSGKSALAQTISETCAETRLGASFFFSVIDPLRNNPDRFVASLAYQISRSMEEAETHILRAVEKDPAIFKMSMETQAEVLLINPVLNAIRRWRSKRHWIIIVDGLDECKGEDHQAQVIRVLHTCVDKGLPFRIFLTSRPEYAIRSALASTGGLSGAYHIILNEHDATADIRLYLRRRLREMGRSNGDSHWPSEDLLEILVQGASGQFIYATTLLKFVGDHRRSPFSRLQIVIDWISNSPNKRSRNPFASLDALYTNILSAAQTAYQESFEGEGECPRLIYRLMSFVLIGDLHIIEVQSLAGARTIERLLMWDDHECNHIFDDLQSVIRVTDYGYGELNKLNIAFYHKSFLDYLLDSSRCRSFHVPPDMLIGDLAVKSLDHVLAVDLDCEFSSALNLVLTSDLHVTADIRGSRAMHHRIGLRATDVRQKYSLDVLDLALLAWPRLLPLALIICPDMPIYNQICEAVVKLSGGGWDRLVKLGEHSGLQSATSSKGLMLLSVDAHKRNHPILELCKSLPVPELSSRPMYASPRRVTYSPALFYPLHKLLEQSHPSLRQVEPERKPGKGPKRTEKI